MINKSTFSNIDIEIKKSINEILDKLKEKNTNNYILFLADGEYVSEYENSGPKLSPYCIDYRIDGYKDLTRQGFLSKFMSQYYSFKNSLISTDDNEYRMNLELMVYTHIWESKPFLKKLYRIAHLLNNEQYNWKMQILDTSKHDFIRSHIRQVFKDLGFDIWKVIKNGFHTSLRNAFAHSEYSFDKMNTDSRINLYNYGGANWELQKISFDDWSKRFVYSALLSWHFLKIIHERKTNIIRELGTNTFQIYHPRRSGELRLVEIEYQDNGGGFSFKS
jgi:hypothetical protein